MNIVTKQYRDPTGEKYCVAYLDEIHEPVAYVFRHRAPTRAIALEQLEAQVEDLLAYIQNFRRGPIKPAKRRGRKAVQA